MNLLVTGAWQNAKEYLQQLRDMGHAVVFLQQERDPLSCPETWVEGVICNGLFLYHPVESFPNLRYIQLTSAGYDRVPMEYIRRKGIVIHNARGVYSVPMAEYALGGVLQIYKQFPFFRENQKQRRWEKHRELLELSGKVVCIVGCGSVGSECAKRFQAFGCSVIGIATGKRVQPFFDAVAALEQMDEILGGADIVILALPLTEGTRHLIDRDRLSRMKPGVVLVNIARGPVIDTRALETALAEKQLRGAVLDVFEEEPLEETSPLWDMENVLITPHNSFVGDGVRHRLAKIIMEHLRGA